jgi:RNA polymerase sigma-70 factor (family 1)
MNYSLFSDSFLVEALHNGDEKAFKAIYQRYWKKLFYVAFRKGLSWEEAEELVQNLFVSLWEKRVEVSIEHLDRYLHTSLKYLVINLLRSKKMEAKYVLYGQQTFSQVDEGTEAIVALADLSDALEQGVARLPEKTRTIFKMNRLEHHSVKEISESLNLPSRTVEYHITQALKRLRLHLKDFVFSVLVCLFSFFN